MSQLAKWRREARMSQYWVFVKGEESKPRNVTPLSLGAARWYADTLAIELGVEVKVFRHGQTRDLGRIVSTHLPLKRPT